MKKWFLYIGLTLFAGTFVGCAGTGSYESVWRSSLESQKGYDESWNIVVNAIATKFSDIETIDGKSGYLRTAWKVVKESGTDSKLYFFGYTQKRTRVVVRVEQREPFKVRIKVERMVYTDKWEPYGNDESVESELMEEINARL